MVILLSPAKNLDDKKEIVSDHITVPEMMDDSIRLMKKMKALSSRQISKLMGISPALADLNVERNQVWSDDFKKSNSRPAIYTFSGDVYRGFAVEKMNQKDLQYAQDKLRIISGLHGLLKPMDLIKPYRLEMGSKLKVTGKIDNLYKFWGSKITDAINELVDKNKDEVIVNLASAEYYKAVKEKELKAKVVHPLFKDWKNGEYKAIMTYAKIARGLMAQYIVKNRVNTIAGVKEFNLEGYAYNDKLSEGDQLVFTRE